MEKVVRGIGQPSYRGRLKNRTYSVTQQRAARIAYTHWLTRGQHRTGGGVRYLRRLHSHCYLAPVRSAMYRDQHVSRSAGSHISKTFVQASLNSLHVCGLWPWLGLATVQLLCTSGLVDDVVLSLTGHGTRKDIHRSRFQRIRHAVTLRTSLLDYIISYVMAAPGAKFAIIDCLVCVFIWMQIQRTGFISCNSDTTYLSARLCSLESTPGFSPLTTYSHLS